MKSTTFAFATYFVAVLAQTPSLTELIASQDDLSTLGGALGMIPELAKTVSGLKDITILAPTNKAFEALLAMDPNTENTAIKMNNTEAIAALLAYHVLNGTYASTDFSEIPTYQNSLLTPSFAVGDSVLTNVTMGQNVGLVLNDKSATILSGDLETSTVVEADITAIPGITIHKIDTVLTLPKNASTTLSALPQVGPLGALGALTLTDLVETVDTVQDMTIFVPNDDAFKAAASAFGNASLETLASVLTYHVVAGSVVFASDVANGTAKTVNGEEITLSVGSDGTVYVDNAKVVFPNILLSNGVAHVIDVVLNPAQGDVMPASGTPTPAFSGATAVGTDIPFASAAVPASSSLSIPALATTAQFVSSGAGMSATGTPTSGATPTPSSSEFPGAAGKVKGGLGGAVVGLGMALLL